GARDLEEADAGRLTGLVGGEAHPQLERHGVAGAAGRRAHVVQEAEEAVARGAGAALAGAAAGAAPRVAGGVVGDRRAGVAAGVDGLALRVAAGDRRAAAAAAGDAAGVGRAAGHAVAHRRAALARLEHEIDPVVGGVEDLVGKG